MQASKKGTVYVNGVTLPPKEFPLDSVDLKRLASVAEAHNVTLEMEVKTDGDQMYVAALKVSGERQNTFDFLKGFLHDDEVALTWMGYEFPKFGFPTTLTTEFEYHSHVLVANTNFVDMYAAIVYNPQTNEEHGWWIYDTIDEQLPPMMLHAPYDIAHEVMQLLHGFITK